MLDRYAGSLPRGGGAAVMPTDDLVAFFAEWRDYSSDAVQMLTSSEQASQPTLEYLALIRWTQDTHAHWETRHPLEEPLSSDLRELLPVAAALAVVDGDFLVPGRHGFHRMMDALSAACIGWHAGLGRAGEPLRQKVQETVQSARRWFDDRRVDFNRLALGVQEQAAADDERGQRMVKRAIDAERGRLRAASARSGAAEMINAMLAAYRTPRAIANFLKGPWYDSAQLVLLKHGPDSNEWRGMRKTTEVLLKSLQSAPDQEDRHALQMIKRLPGEIGSWLVSLQHDTEAQRNATQLIEYAHLRNLRDQPLELVANDPIADPQVAGGESDDDAMRAVANLSEGQWFRVLKPGEQPRRARLVLKLQDERQLLFANLIGIKEMQSSYAGFGAMLRSGEARPLAFDEAYSTALRQVAEGDTAAESTVGSTGGDTEETDEQPPAPGDAEQLQPQADYSEFAPRPEEQRNAARVSYLKLVDTDAGDEAFEPDIVEAGRDPAADLDAEMVLSIEEEAPPPEKPEDLKLDPDADLDFDLDTQEAGYALDSMTQEEENTPDPSPDLWRRAAIETGAAATPPPGQAPPPRHREPGAAGEPTGESRKTGLTGAPDSLELNLPMGAWLGFHDLDTPLMAKLAVHDRDQDSYIFVNRNGIKLRDITRHHLLELIERGDVEILQAQSNFQEFLKNVRRPK